LKRLRGRELKGKLQNEVYPAPTAVLQTEKENRNPAFPSGPVESNLFLLVQLFGQTHTHTTPELQAPLSLQYKIRRIETKLKYAAASKRNIITFNLITHFTFFYFEECNITAWN
jgi:hypothetical protein